MGQLLERQTELEALQDAVEAARAGQGLVVLIGGEAGIGKTSLWRALRGRARSDASFFVGFCEPLSVPVPLAPVLELIVATGTTAPAELDGGDRLALTRSLLAGLDGRAPAVAIIEDVHWADPATLEVIRLLARRIEDFGVLALVTYRDDEAAGNPALTELVGDLATCPTARRMSLPRLSEAAVRGLAEPAGVDSHELTRVTGGNPFLVAESLAAGGGLPASVRDATLARVGRLAPSARGVVDAAAVIGQRVAPRLLARVWPHLPEQVEAALACGVLVQEGERLGFRHELTRQAIEESISAPRRAELHARVVTALTGRAAVIDHARVAHHAEQAGLGPQAARHATLAAAEAEGVGALREAGLQLDRALRLGADADRRERFGLLLRFARVTNFEGRMEDSVAAARAAASIAERDLGPREHGRALNQLVASLWSLDRFAQARDTALEAIAVLGAANAPAELARAHAAYLRVLAVACDPAAVIAGAGAALERAARAGLAEAEIDVRISLAVARAHRGEPGVSEQLADAFADARAGGLHLQTIRAIVNIMGTAADARDHATVDGHFELAMTVADEFQAAIPRAAVMIAMGRSQFDRGRWDDALATAAVGTRDWFGEVPIALSIEGLIRGPPR